MSYAVIRDLQNQYRYEVGSSLITALQAYSQPSIEANRRILEAEYAKKNPPELLKMLQQARTDLADEKTAKSQAYAFEVTVAKEIGDMIQAEKMSAASRRKVSTRAADSAKDERDALLVDLADAQEELLLESNAIKGVAKQLQILTPGIEVFKDVGSQADLQRAMTTYMTIHGGDPDNLGLAVRKYIGTTNYARNQSPDTKLEFNGKELGGLTVANIEDAFINKFAPVASYGGTALGAGDEGVIAASLFDSAKKTIEGTYADRITAGATVPMRSEAQIEADVRARFAKGGEEIEKAAKLREESIAIKEAEVKRLEDMYKGVATGSARTPEQVLMQDYGVRNRAFDTPFYDPQPARTMKEPRDPREPRERVEREAREKAERETRERVERDRQRRFGRVPDPVAPAALDDLLDDEPAVVEDSLLDEVLISEEEEKRDIIANIMLMDPKYVTSKEDMASLQKAPIAALRDVEGQIQRDRREKGKSAGRGGKIIDTTTTDDTLRGFALADKERSDRISLIGTADDPYGTKRDPGTGLPVEDLAIIQEVMDAFPLDLDEDIVFGDRKLNLGPTASSVDIDLELLDEMGEREPIEINGTPLSEINPKLNERYEKGQINRQNAIREAKTRLLFEMLRKDETSDEEIASSFEKENEEVISQLEERIDGLGDISIEADIQSSGLKKDLKKAIEEKDQKALEEVSQTLSTLEAPTEDAPVEEVAVEEEAPKMKIDDPDEMTEAMMDWQEPLRKEGYVTFEAKQIDDQLYLVASKDPVEPMFLNEKLETAYKKQKGSSEPVMILEGFEVFIDIGINGQPYFKLVAPDGTEQIVDELKNTQRYDYIKSQIEALPEPKRRKRKKK